MRALVTGCAGFIGSQLTESLLGEGHEVVGVDCFNDNYGRRDKLRNLEAARSWDAFEFVPIDLSRGDLNDLVLECEVVFHLAAEPGVRASWGRRFQAYVRNNVEAMQHLLEASLQVPERRFIYASSSSIYGDAEKLPTPEDATPAPVSPYGVTKLTGEHLCHTYHRNWGVATASLRFFSVFGPRQRPDMAFTRFCRAALRDEPIDVFGDGEQTRDFTFVGDVVRALRAAAEVPESIGRVYNVGGGAQRSVNDALQIIEELAGRPLVVRRGPTEKGDVRDTSADTSRIRAELGWQPEVGFRDGLAAQFEWAAAELDPAAAGHPLRS
jgi:nucleoside-diphosphate-sugar epimerase